MPRMPSSVGMARASAPFSAAFADVVELVGLLGGVGRELGERLAVPHDPRKRERDDEPEREHR